MIKIIIIDDNDLISDDDKHLQVLELNLPTVCWQSVPEAAGRDGGHVFRHLVMIIVMISLMIVVMITVMIMTFMIMIMMILMIMITIMKPESYHTGEYPGGEPCSTSLSDCSPSCISSGCDYKS